MGQYIWVVKNVTPGANIDNSIGEIQTGSGTHGGAISQTINIIDTSSPNKVSGGLSPTVAPETEEHRQARERSAKRNALGKTIQLSVSERALNSFTWYTWGDSTEEFGYRQYRYKERWYVVNDRITGLPLSFDWQYNDDPQLSRIDIGKRFQKPVDEGQPWETWVSRFPNSTGLRLTYSIDYAPGFYMKDKEAPDRYSFGLLEYTGLTLTFGEVYPRNETQPYASATPPNPCEISTVIFDGESTTPSLSITKIEIELPDNESPEILEFTMPSLIYVSAIDAITCKVIVPVTSFIVSDNITVAGYKLDVANVQDSSGIYSPIKPTSLEINLGYIPIVETNITVIAYVVDGAGNTSFKSADILFAPDPIP